MKKIIYLFCIIAFTNLATAQNNEVSNDPEYQLHYNKYKELYLKRIFSEAYINYEKVFDHYKKMINYEHNKYRILNVKDLGAWTRAHLSDTKFKSIKEADDEWIKLLDATELERKQNNEFDTYQYKVLKLPYGPRLMALVLIDIMTVIPEHYGLSKEKVDGLKEYLKKQKQ
ncbi:hypothetical protein AM493_02815 [Flavobacterium akiainvivens]|uniref:Uncharacterized protein n=1 Tax=Flavobacterium akiainvivens TaxID=1202724 RepID=A0A0M8M7M1_9FLAO|nr:hypothetical protein [Flavobacterium akiainvivens]KOS05083.1 hypothetical protein AM493_02815 [Flavobacterium akiainvivens]SFQ51802.1 hypothetical protein SAMN05444144_106241 [Flavobacterium akiainvivens]